MRQAALGPRPYSTISQKDPNSTRLSWRWAQPTIMTSPAAGNGAPSHQPNGPLIFEEKNGALFGATADTHYGQGIIFELAPPEGGSSAWRERILDNSHTIFASLG